MKVLNITAIISIDKIANSDTALEEYSVKVEQYAAEVGKFLADANNQFANKDDALVATVFAKTIDSTSKTILR